MSRKVPNFNTVFKDILLGPKPEPEVPKESQELVKPLTFIPDRGRFEADHNILHYPVPSLTLKNDLCPTCGDLRFHEKFDACQIHRRKVSRSPSEQEVLKQGVVEQYSEHKECSDEEKDPDVERINKIFELSASFETNKVRKMAGYGAGYGAYKRSAEKLSYRKPFACGYFKESGIYGNAGGGYNIGNSTDCAQFLKKGHRTFKATNFDGSGINPYTEKSYQKKNSSAITMDLNAEEVPSSNPMPTEESWEKSFGFRKGPKKEQTENIVNHSEIWDNNEYFNVYGANMDNIIPRKAKSLRDKKGGHRLNY